jgi:hypothetical protein
MATKKTTTTAKKAPVAAVAPKKKVVAKKAAKKVAAKKVQCATCKAVSLPGQEFWVNNGPVVDSLKGLRQALEALTDEQYTYHTGRAGNDFAVWVRECLDDNDTAVRIAKAQSKDAAVRAIVCTCSAK